MSSIAASSKNTAQEATPDMQLVSQLPFAPLSQVWGLGSGGPFEVRPQNRAQTGWTTYKPRSHMCS